MNEDINNPTKRINQNNSAMSVAPVAVFMGALWVLEYITSTSMLYYQTNTPLLAYIIGIEYFQDDASNVLVVAVLRFILATGLSWAPLTLLAQLVTKVRT